MQIGNGFGAKCAVVLGLLALSCSDDDVDFVDRPTGTLEMHWTIGGEADEAACDELDAEIFEVIVFDRGVVDAILEAPCDDFEASVLLFVDDYVARTTLQDEFGFSVTGRVILDRFLIRTDETTRLEVDFPAAGTGGDGADAGAGNGEADGGS